MITSVIVNSEGLTPLAISGIKYRLDKRPIVARVPGLHDKQGDRYLGPLEEPADPFRRQTLMLPSSITVTFSLGRSW